MILYILFSIIGVLFLLYIVLCRLYYNPHTFIFIFGKKGSGKSCYMVHEMLKYLKKGWTVYSDMPVNLPNVRYIQDANKLFKEYTPDAHSVIFLDEIGITWHSRNYKEFDSRIREWFKLQRKYQCRIYCNSQSWDVDKSLRQLNDRLILQTNIGNFLSVSRPIIRSVTVTEATSEGESRIADQLKFAPIWQARFYWMPKYFKYFNSYDAPYRPAMPYTMNQTKYSYKELRKMGFSKKVAHKIESEYNKDIYDND